MADMHRAIEIFKDIANTPLPTPDDDAADMYSVSHHAELRRAAEVALEEAVWAARRFLDDAGHGQDWSALEKEGN